MTQQRKAHYLLGTPSGREWTDTVSVAPTTSASGTNGLKRADYRFASDQNRTIFGTLTSGAHINLYVYPFPGDTTTKHLEAVISAESSIYVSATNSFSDVLNGPFHAVEAVKVCAGGGATLVAYL